MIKKIKEKIERIKYYWSLVLTTEFCGEMELFD